LNNCERKGNSSLHNRLSGTIEETGMRQYMGECYLLDLSQAERAMVRSARQDISREDNFVFGL